MESSNASPRIRLRVLGLSYREIQKGAYALILAETDGPHYIPIVIGTPEAQSIAMRLENISAPRPITHDLFASFAHAFGVRLREVFISKFDDGIFISELIFEGIDGHTVTLDARTSDAIAIAMRTDSPIFTTPEIIATAGFVMDEPQREPLREKLEEIRLEPVIPPDSDLPDLGVETGDPVDAMDLSELEGYLATLIAEERYEEAARVSEIIKARKSKGI